MPRQTIAINNFSGGLSNHGTAKDIQEKELYVANNILVSTEGLITVPGGPEEVSSPNWATIFADLTSGTVKTGYGLFTFSADRTSTGGQTPTDYLCFGSKTAGNLKAVVVSESDGTKWVSTAASSIISVTTAASTYDYLPVFYFVNDGLRICDANFEDTATTRQGLFYIKHTVFRIYNSTTNFGSYDNWYNESADIVAPTQGLFADKASSILTGPCTTSANPSSQLTVTGSLFAGFSSTVAGYYAYNVNDALGASIISATDSVITCADVASLSWDNADVYRIVPAAGLGFNVEVERDDSGTVGTWTTGAYEIAGSFIYDRTQESPLYSYVSTKAFTLAIANSALDVRLTFNGPYNKRITGARAYIRKRNSNDFWSLLADVDFTKEQVSGRTALDVPFSARNSGGGSNIFISGNIAAPYGLRLSSPNVDSYESVSGVPSETTTMGVKYKTVAVSNNITYVGNVQIGGKIYEDSIFKSHVNAHDMFYTQRRLDIASGDGERITALHSFADRLLEFKERTMYIINISQDVEFLEDVHFYKGVSAPHQTVNTEYGVAWINSYGVYLYNGERVIDLFLDPQVQGRRKIDLGYYRSFLGTTPTITYDGREKRLLIISGTTGLTTTSPSLLIYDMLDNSWVRWDSTSGNHSFSKGTHVFTNFITDWNRYPSVIDTADKGMIQWISTNGSTTNSLEVQTKNFDFGEPGLEKKVYKVYITYKGSNLTPYFKVNEDTKLYNLHTTTSSTQINLPSASSYTTLELKPTTPSDAKNIYSFQFVLKPTTGATITNFGVNDITVIGRIKGKR
jgi:hypothetical protein